MEKRDMLIVVLVVLLVLLAFSKLGTIGNAINQLKCSDTDGGGNKFVKGTINGVDTTGSKFEMTDYCTSDGRLKEYRCNIGQGDPSWENIYYYCDNGCVDGACA